MRRKDKNAEQQAAKKEKKEQQAAEKAKKRQIEPELAPQKPALAQKPTILIVCEGENTEPSYFEQFRLTSAHIKPVGTGYNTSSLVNRAIQLAQEKVYNQVWCVFDRDQHNHFNQAIQLAEKNNFDVAYSNQAFEYWLILHFEDHQGGSMDRKDYDAKLNQYLKNFGVVYDGKKSKIISENFFEILDGIDEKTQMERKQLAIKRAKQIYDRCEKVNPAQEESSTTVFKLVEELLKHI